MRQGRKIAMGLGRSSTGENTIWNSGISMMKINRTMRRNDWHMKPGEFHLTVLGVIARPDGTFLITKRVMTKAWAPGWWEVSGGAAQAGESSWEAVRREVREETGLDVSKADGGYLFTYRRINPDEGDNYFVDVYRFVMDVKDEDLHLQVDSIRQAFEL